MSRRPRRDFWCTLILVFHVASKIVMIMVMVISYTVVTGAMGASLVYVLGNTLTMALVGLYRIWIKTPFKDTKHS